MTPVHTEYLPCVHCGGTIAAFAGIANPSALREIVKGHLERDHALPPDLERALYGFCSEECEIAGTNLETVAKLRLFGRVE